MKKLFVLFLSLVLVFGAVAQAASVDAAVTPTVGGEFVTNWGIDLNNMYSGFTNSADFWVSIPLVTSSKSVTGEKANDIYATVAVSGIGSFLQSYNNANAFAGVKDPLNDTAATYTATAKINFGPMYVTVGAAPSLSIGYASNALVSPTHLFNVAMSSTILGTTKGVELGGVFMDKALDFAVKVASKEQKSGDAASVSSGTQTTPWLNAKTANPATADTQNVANNYAYGLFVNYNLQPAAVVSMFKLGAKAVFMPYKSTAAFGAGADADKYAHDDMYLGLGLNAVYGMPLNTEGTNKFTFTLPVDCVITSDATSADANVGIMGFDVNPEAKLTMNDSSVALSGYVYYKTTATKTSATVSSTETLLTVDPYLTFTEDGEKGFVPNLGASLTFGLVGLVNSHDTTSDNAGTKTSTKTTNDYTIGLYTNYVVDFTIDYTIEKVKPYLGLGYGGDQVFNLNVGVEYSGIDKVTLTLDYASPSLVKVDAVASSTTTTGTTDTVTTITPPTAAAAQDFGKINLKAKITL